MAKHPAPIAAPEEDLPPTKAELEEGSRIAYQHFRHILRLLQAEGRTIHPPKRRRTSDKIKAGTEIRRALPLDPGSLDQHLSEMAQTLFHHCKRPECRRAFQCRYGARAGETSRTATSWGLTGLPCLQQLPPDVAHALRLMLARQSTPQVFRARNNFQALERQVMARAAKRFGLGDRAGETAKDATVRSGIMASDRQKYAEENAVRHDET
ncbi:hypothetical protein [Fulvimarina sp. MAC3]|uniref:hypothetical protein n=1 Tax=Fulvimarina sp. MAC3 TaxID=3148887 RepID=UPI0031FBB3DE